MRDARSGDLVADGNVGLEAADEGEAGRAAMGTPRPRARRWRVVGRRLVIRSPRREEQLEAPQRVALGRVQQPESTNAMHALRRDMLQESRRRASRSSFQ